MQGVVKAEPVPGVRLSRDLSEPVPESGEVVVEVAATSVCGTDLELYEWSESAQGFDPKLPFVMGHECSGTVVAVGPGVDSVSVGDRVAYFLWTMLLVSHWQSTQLRTSESARDNL